MRYLTVTNFERFQHYRDRAPTWIKLYNSILDDYAFVALPEAARAQLMLLWLVASRHDNRIPYDEAFIREQLHVRSRLHLGTLIEAGFVAVVEQDASTTLARPGRDVGTVLARAEQDAPPALASSEHTASPRGRGRALTRGREEKDTHNVASVREGNGTSPPPDLAAAHPRLGRFLASCPPDKRQALSRRLEAWLAGNGVPPGQTPTLEVLAAALDEYVDEGGNYAPAHVWSFVARKARQFAPHDSGTNGTGGWARLRLASEDADDRVALGHKVQQREYLVRLRRERDDGEDWWARMEREARAQQQHPIVYAYDRRHEAAHPDMPVAELSRT